MSFGTAALRFAAQAARERATLFAGETAAGGYNLQFGETKFTAAFVDSFDRQITDVGEQWIVGATLLLPDSLGLTAIDLGSQLTHLPTGKVYEVETIRRPPGAAERRATLRRLE